MRNKLFWASVGFLVGAAIGLAVYSVRGTASSSREPIVLERVNGQLRWVDSGL